MQKISFSIIVPLFNKEFSIKSTIESILNQRYQSFEIIIINDGSTDNSLAVVQSFKDQRIRIINKINEGVSSARNRGIKESKNNYLVFLDADDLWYPDCLDEFCILIRKFSNAKVFSTNFNMTGKNLRGSNKRYLVTDYYYSSSVFLAKWNIQFLVTGCVAIEKSCFNIVQGYNKNLTHGEDIEFWTRLSEHFLIAKSEKITMLYRTSAENRASDVPKIHQKRIESLTTNKDEIKNPSQKLYIGCKMFSSLPNQLKKLKSWSELTALLPYWSWILRGALLYIKYRPLIKLSNLFDSLKKNIIFIDFDL